jgi:hypothetical protein
LTFELANVFIQQLPFTKKGREMLQPSTDINAPAPDLQAMAGRFGLTEPEHIDAFIDETEELLEDTGTERLESRIIRACTKNPMFQGASATALANTYEITSAEGRSQLEHYALLTGSSVQMMVKQGFKLDEIVELHGLVDPVVIEAVKKEIAKQEDSIAGIANMRIWWESICIFSLSHQWERVRERVLRRAHPFESHHAARPYCARRHAQLKLFCVTLTQVESFSKSSPSWRATCCSASSKSTLALAVTWAKWVCSNASLGLRCAHWAL